MQTVYESENTAIRAEFITNKNEKKINTFFQDNYFDNLMQISNQSTCYTFPFSEKYNIHLYNFAGKIVKRIAAPTLLDKDRIRLRMVKAEPHEVTQLIHGEITANSVIIQNNNEVFYCANNKYFQIQDKEYVTVTREFIINKFPELKHEF